MTDIELKPCPFCGSKAEFTGHCQHDSVTPTKFAVGCSTPYCVAWIMDIKRGLVHWSGSRDGAALAWNRRPDASALAPSTSAQVEGGPVAKNAWDFAYECIADPDGTAWACPVCDYQLNYHGYGLTECERCGTNLDTDRVRAALHARSALKQDNGG